MNIAEQIRALEATRAAKAARMAEVTKASVDAGRSMDAAEGEEFDTLDGEIKQLDGDLVRLRRLEQLNGQAAKPVNATTESRATESRSTGPAIIVNREKEDTFKGQAFTRLTIAKALARINQTSASAIAQHRWGKSNPLLVEWIKANEVAGGGAGSGEWGAELVAADGRYTGDFIEFLNNATVYNKLPLRSVPANVLIKGQDGAATGYWVGESKAIPASKADFNSVQLTPLKVAALAVISNELIRDSSPSAEQLVRDALIEASAQRIDTTFLSTAAASAGVSPAGLLNGLAGHSSAGTDADGLREDIKTLYSGFLAAKNASGLYFVMNPSMAKSISLMRNALDQVTFPGLSSTGGVLEGDQVVTGDNVNTNHLILLKPSDIYKIGDGGVQVSISQEAMIEQNSSPSGASDTPTAAANTLMSMFQTESTAIKVVHSLNFAKRRTSAVDYIGDGDYGNVVSP